MMAKSAMQFKATNAGLTGTVERVARVRWCRSCNQWRSPSGGQEFSAGRGGRVRRWTCAECWAKRRPSGA